MALVVDFNAFGQETFATMTTTAVKNGATVFGFHPGTETELTFTSALGRLIGWFHDRDAVSGVTKKLKVGREGKRRTSGVKQGL